MGRRYTAPTDLIHLRAWVTSSTPYTLTNHTKTPFPCVNDFATPELEEVLRFGLETFDKLNSELFLESAKFESPFNVRCSPGVIVHIPTDAFSEMILAAKYGSDLMFEKCVVGLATGIKKLKVELLKARLPKTGNTTGDEDDWFLPGAETRGVEHEEIEIGWLPEKPPL